MAGRLLIWDTFASQPFVLPARDGWIPPNSDVNPVTTLDYRQVGATDFALISSVDAVRLYATHQIGTSISVVLTGAGPIAMQSPVRPDQIDLTSVRLYHASATAEWLARATLSDYFGIKTTGWSETDDANAQVVVIEGADALVELEGGIREDLVRAWFILTGLALPYLLLAVPRKSDTVERETVLAYLGESLRLANERRRDLRALVSESTGAPRETVTAAYLAQRYNWIPEDLQALRQLLFRGARGQSTDLSGQIEIV